jgi:hypothetical protein
MSKGDVSFTFITAGSSSASTTVAYPLLGIYNGLSQLNEDEVVHIQITSGGSNEFFIGTTGNVSNNIGYKIYPSLSTVDLPPMRVGQASGLLVSRAVSGVDPVYTFVVWARRP